MVYWRHEVLENSTGLTENGSNKFELPESGLLSGLQFYIACDQNSANSGKDEWRIQDKIDKIEVIGNGSYPICSISGRQLHALHFYDTLNGPVNVNREYASNTQWANFWLGFGRYPGDSGMGINLGEWNSVEFKLTNTLDSTNWQATASIRLIGMFAEESSPTAMRGWLRKTELRSYTNIQNATEQIEIPAEFLMRRIMVMVDPAVTTTEADTYFYNCIYNTKLSFNERKIRVFDAMAEDLMHLNATDYGHAMQDGRVYRTTGTFFNTGVGRRTSLTAMDSTNTGAAAATSVGTDDGTKNTAKVYGTGGDVGAWFLARGTGIENTVLFPFTYPDEPAAYLDTVARKRVWLDLQTRDSGSADNATVQVVTEEFVPTGQFLRR